MALDFVITIFIFFFWNALFIGLASKVSFGEVLIDLLATVFDPEPRRREEFILVISVLTTFTASLWLWLFGLAQLTIRLSRYTVQSVHFLNIEKAPFSAIGLVANNNRVSNKET